MAPPEIKICGIADTAALDAAIGAGADHIGLVFFPPSPRCLTFDRARELAARAAGRIGKVGLLVDPGDEQLAQAIAAGSLDAVQLHGSETPERSAQVRARFGLPVWKVIPVGSPADVARAAAYRDAADLVLFDAKTPKGALPGGMGLTFDWAMLAGVSHPQRWGLAGGLGPANVAEAIHLTGAPLVDASSGLESAPGVKDPGRIRAFVAAARAA